MESKEDGLWQVRLIISGLELLSCGVLWMMEARKGRFMNQRGTQVVATAKTIRTHNTSLALGLFREADIWFLGLKITCAWGRLYIGFSLSRGTPCMGVVDFGSMATAPKTRAKRPAAVSSSGVKPEKPSIDTAVGPSML